MAVTTGRASGFVGARRRGRGHPHRAAGGGARDAGRVVPLDFRRGDPAGGGGLAAVASPGRGAGLRPRDGGASRPSRAVPAALGPSAALLVVEWAVAGSMPRAAAVALYLHMGVFGATLVSAYWSLVNESFDPYTAKRIIGRIGTGASLGGALGGLSPGRPRA